MENKVEKPIIVRFRSASKVWKFIPLDQIASIIMLDELTPKGVAIYEVMGGGHAFRVEGNNIDPLLDAYKPLVIRSQ